jgi:hypothetical protein
LIATLQNLSSRQLPASKFKAEFNMAIDETPISPSRPDYHVRQNSLEKHLLNRPDPKELKERHILLDTNAAP